MIRKVYLAGTAAVALLMVTPTMSSAAMLPGGKPSIATSENSFRFAKAAADISEADGISADPLAAIVALVGSAVTTGDTAGEGSASILVLLIGTATADGSGARPYAQGVLIGGGATGPAHTDERPRGVGFGAPFFL